MGPGKIVVSMTGASGAAYGSELIKALGPIRKKGLELSLIYNDTAMSILENETGEYLSSLQPMVDEIIHNGRMDHSLASGSNSFDCLIVCPCSTSTVGKVHSGISDNLTTRLASVALKERRKLILVIRETPLSTPTLRAMFELSSWGVTIMPASPPFYNLVSDSIKELQKGFAGRIMDLLSIENTLTPRYDPDREGKG